MQLDLPPLDILPSTPITGGYFQLQELGIPHEEEEEVLVLGPLFLEPR